MTQNWTLDFFPVHIASSIFYRPLLELSRYSTGRLLRDLPTKILMHFNTPYEPCLTLSILLILR